MANSNAGVPRGKVFHGARAYLVINGRTIGYCLNVQGTETIEYQPVDVLDSLEVEEFVAVAYTVNFSVGLLKIFGRSVKAAGLLVPLAQVLTAGDLVVEVKDRPEDKPTYVLEGAKFSSRTFGAAKRTLTVEQLNGVAKRLRDESGLV